MQTETIIPAVRTAQMKLLRLNLSGMGGHLTDAVLVVISQVCTQLGRFPYQAVVDSQMSGHYCWVAVCERNALVRLKKKGRRELTRNGMGGIGNP